MGWFANLLRRGGKAGRASSLSGAVSFEDGFLSLGGAHDWFGPATASPDGRWILSWLDADLSAGRGGARDSGMGSYILVDVRTPAIAVRGKLERPNNGHVANNGTFVLEDWHFANTLSGTFVAFNAEGRQLLGRHLQANLMGNGISVNGRFAVCQTANSGHVDGSSLFLFDLASGAELFSAPPMAGWTMDYDIDEDTVEVIAQVKDLGAFRYGQDGTFLDAMALEESSLARGDFATILRVCDDILARPETTLPRVRQLLPAIARARRKGADRDPCWKAMALKVQGIAHELLGEVPKAIEMFDAAIALNPRVGLKRRVAALRKRRT